ncbi:hypothetical protein AVEN_233417-1 [Araneus ventricosus]|uniref:Uncharacterized protein n=1 Tax=Araneus ventricosus TaxID=182803 RepID=A0A4Y2JXW2_ARAVE|nr:hypothetical protein AVEN_233417-1 [Araneus ventricosus]
MILCGGIPINSKSKTSCADSDLRPDARLAAHQRVCLDWDLATRVENWKSTEWGRNKGDRTATVTQFGAYSNDVNNFSVQMGGGKTGLGQMAFI